jgi:hypothetical protein
MSSITSMITKAKSFNASDVTYREPVVNKRGGKSVQLQLGGQPIVLQIPLMLTWGVNERVDDTSGRVSYDMALQFNDDSPSVLKFLEAIKVLEEKIKNDSCTTMSKKWHGKSKISREVMDALMYPILKYPRLKDAAGQPTSDPDFSRYPTMKLKIPFWEGKFNVELYNMQRQPLYLSSGATGPNVTPVTAIPKASNINGLIQCTGIWFAGGKCGVTWKLVQACVRPPARLLGSGTCHVLADSDDEEAEEAISQKEQAQQAAAAGPSFEEDDDEDVEEMDEEEEEVEEEEVEPVPKKKKVVRKKKKKSSD